MYSQRPIRGRFCTTLRHVPHGSGDNQEFLSRPRAQPLSCFDTPWGVGGAPDDGRKLGHWRRASATEGRTRRDSSLASRSCRAAAASTRAPFLTTWTSMPSCPVDPRSPSSTNSRTPTSRDRATRNAGRTSTSCSTPGSTSSPPSTSSTWSRSTMPSPRSRASSSRRRSPTRSSAPPTRSTSSTCPRRRFAGGWPTATCTGPRRWTLPSPTTSGSGTCPRCGSWRCCGWPRRLTPVWRDTGLPTASPSSGRPASGWWWLCPAALRVKHCCVGAPGSHPGWRAGCFSPCSSRAPTAWPTPRSARSPSCDASPRNWAGSSTR